MNLIHFHVSKKLSGYFTPLVVPGVSSGNFAWCRVKVISSGILAVILDGFFSHNLYQGICPGIPDGHHQSDGQTEWAMH